MNRKISIAIGAIMALVAYNTPALAADVGVSISVGDPYFYGRIDIGDAPRPRIIYAQPVIVERTRYVQEPVYLHVRPGHARRWKRHCHEYDACGQRVYFVNDNWYETVYVDHHRQRRANDRDYGRRDHDGRRGDHDGHDHQGRGDRGNDHGNNGRGNDNGRGRGNGKYDD